MSNRKYTAEEKKSNWVAVKNGFLKIGHKPGGQKFPIEALHNAETDTVLTLLSEREGAVEIGEKVKSFGINWIWLKLKDGKIPPKTIVPEIITIFDTIKEKLEKGKRIFIHCSAGMHRTGMITNAFLHYIGYTQDEALKTIQELRIITSIEVREKRLKWGRQFGDGNYEKC